MTSIEEVLSTESGSVSPSSSHRILGLWEDFFFPALRLFKTEEGFTGLLLRGHEILARAYLTEKTTSPISMPTTDAFIRLKDSGCHSIR